MITSILDIGGSLRFESTIFESGLEYACFEYTERSPDSWYGDRITSVDIDRNKALELVDALSKHFDIRQAVNVDAAVIIPHHPA